MKSIPLPDWPRVPNISKAELPYPDGYAQLITLRLLSRGESAEVSAPQPYEPWSINEPVGWYVCLKRENGEVTAVILSASAVKGTIHPAPSGYCESPGYSPVARAP